MNDIPREFEKAARHWKLALIIDGLLAILVGGPIWAVLHTPDNTVGPFIEALQWWPWTLALMVGMVVYYMICDDHKALRLVVDLPRVLLFAVILLITAWWWVPQVRDHEESHR